MDHHHAVLVHFPGMGKSTASQADSSIRSIYPNINLALVVGICGGVPFKKGPAEILLGDTPYSGIEQDELFQSTYRHEHHGRIDCISCAHPTNNTVCDEVFDLSCHQLKCDKDKLVQRKRLQNTLALGHTPSPTIHLGLIASGDTVMRSGQDRDLLAEQ
ncbi:hypothetical protein TSTA_001950 [Talaromyces stipitatus ATCC 10500]|uniref:Nucleoside phosphorylase domain-containing protein n=1 Tax=Talaromyces stipitatus (strain ATCC 10500 / CBS 375.48 / QM 6759 / NRRL 1006) TaxID=441959 RepID=B8MS69_TALSN|nr:uncharacterized protein TSTA_001950 [Talaromyces stipitatus ATCC 10500]EED12127.1 hypothetical protein TSTA_001950 [Talaromyces stipitatus ATCC 10500]